MLNQRHKRILYPLLTLLLLAAVSFILFSVLSALALTPAGAAADRVVTFPGKVPARSPNRLYAVESVEERVSYQAYPKHLLYFVALHQKKKVPLKLCSTGANFYERSVDVLWAPDSNAFVVNDWYGSNVADAYLYFVNDLAHPIDIGAQLKRAVKDKEDQISIENTKAVHTYVVASKWIDATKVAVRIAGDYTSSPNFKRELREFTIYFLWNSRTNSSERIKRVPRYEWPAFQ